jgi:hypothetical protein
MIITVICVLRLVRQTIKSVKSARSINLILISSVILIHPSITINQSISWIEKKVEIYKQVYKLIYIYTHTLKKKSISSSCFTLPNQFFHIPKQCSPHLQCILRTLDTFQVDWHVCLTGTRLDLLTPGWVKISDRCW